VTVATSFLRKMEYGWSLDKSTWNKIPAAVAKGHRWRAVHLTVGNHRTVPQVSGIYVVCAAPPGRRAPLPAGAHDLFRFLYSAIYVGRSDDLRRRFVEHCNSPKEELAQSQECFDSRLDFWFIREPSDTIAALESVLIACLGPQANRISGIRGTLGQPVPA